MWSHIHSRYGTSHLRLTLCGEHTNYNLESQCLLSWLPQKCEVWNFIAKTTKHHTIRHHGSKVSQTNVGTSSSLLPVRAGNRQQTLEWCFLKDNTRTSLFLPLMPLSSPHSIVSFSHTLIFSGIGLNWTSHLRTTLPYLHMLTLYTWCLHTSTLPHLHTHTPIDT